MRIIKFYRVQDECGWLSNFAAYPILLDGRVWPTSEHYFQSQKFALTHHEEVIRRAGSPTAARQMGRDRTKPLRQDWDQLRDDVMLKAVRAKFRQHSDLAAKLVATGNATLVEHTENDRHWGDGGDGTGRNMLGQILMQVRDELLEWLKNTQRTSS